MRMITEGAEPTKGQTSVSYQRAIGCAKENISFSFLDGGSYVCTKEKAIAELILNRNKNLWPAMIIFPTGLATELLYAQCTFKLDSRHDYTYKEAAGINKFLSKGCVLEFLREYNVASVIIAPRSLADAFYALNEPRIEESLFVVKSDAGELARYELRPLKTFTYDWSPTYQFSLTPTGAPYCDGGTPMFEVMTRLDRPALTLRPSRPSLITPEPGSPRPSPPSLALSRSSTPREIGWVRRIFNKIFG
jgi:hypothetical protein